MPPGVSYIVDSWKARNGYIFISNFYLDTVQEAKPEMASAVYDKAAFFILDAVFSSFGT